MPLPGGDQAVRHPSRLAWAYAQALGLDGQFPDRLGLSVQEASVLTTLVHRRGGVTETSSCGRLFDAVSALLGVCRETTYEAQAAIELEVVARGGAGALEGYPFALVPTTDVPAWGRPPTPLSQGWIVRVGPAIEGLLADANRGTRRADVAFRFHRTVAEMVVACCLKVRGATGLGRAALSGGCFQNRLLLQMVDSLLTDAGFEVLVHRQVPCNDGGLSLGQALVAHYWSQGE
jgi:hydrogenase maturation protein HypF